MTVDAGALNALLADPDVTSVSEDRPRFPVLNDTPGITHADQAWVQGFRGAGQVVAIVVFGLINFETYFQGRERAEELRTTDSTLYPHLETTYDYLTSFQPALRGNVIRLAAMVNEELRAMIAELNREARAPSNVQLRYSHALATADLSRAELLHAVDGWHASAQGHNVLAEAAFADLAPSLEFLGIV